MWSTNDLFISNASSSFCPIGFVIFFLFILIDHKIHMNYLSCIFCVIDLTLELSESAEKEELPIAEPNGKSGKFPLICGQ